MRSLRRFLFASPLLFVLATLGRAQIITVGNDQATPVQGAGHDYDKLLSETVQPASGQLSVRIDEPTRPGRGITLPFANLYNSPGVHHVVSTGNGVAEWVSDTADSQGSGWSTTAPTLSAIRAVASTTYPGPPPYTATCTYYTNYIFQDPTGARHTLPIQVAQSNDPAIATTNCNKVIGAPSNVLVGGDGIFNASTTAPTDGTVPQSPSPVTVVGPDGTIYHFSGLTLIYNGWTVFFRSTAGTIEDRNGNVTGTGLGGSDTLGGSSRPIPFTTTSETVPWQKFPFSFVRQDNVAQANCGGISNGPGNLSVYQSISLPNGKSYQFQYDPVYGLLNKITYPTGGYASYTWGLNPISESVSAPDAFGLVCVYGYDTPAVTHRYVSFDGINVALQQDFTYSTTWSSAAGVWTSKQTTVTTTDLIRGTSYQTIYKYAPLYGGNIAVEQSVAYKGFNGNTLRTVTKGWFDQYRLACEVQTLDNGLISGTFYTYGSGGEVTDKKEYDYGLITSTASCYGAGYPVATAPTGITPTRETVVTYQSFPTTPIFTADLSIFDRPASIKTYGNGALLAETDFAYDQAAVAAVSPAATSRDETNYGATSTAPRGNATTATKRCFQGAQTCTNAVSTYTFDETGQVLTKTDPCGNASCSDMTGTSHVTAFSYTDSFDSIPPGNTNAYLTKITRPPANGVNHIESFKYSLAGGELISSTDESGQTTNYLYSDTLRRPTESDFPDGGQATIAYNDTAPSPVATTSRKINATPTFVTTVAAADGLGHLTQAQLTTDPDGTAITDTTYDGLGRVWKQSNPHRAAALPTDGTTTFYYDALGRTCLVVPPDGTLPAGSACPTTQPSNTVFTTYSGNTVTVTDQAGKSRKSISDALGRLTQVFEDPAGLNYETDYTYDALGNLLTANQKGGTADSTQWRTRSFTYDSLSRLLTATNPESGSISYVYDANGNLMTKTAPKPNQTGALTVTATYAYDALNRLTQKSYNDGSTPAVKYAYDGAAAPTGCTLPTLTITNGIGRRTGMCDPAGAEAWSYDSMGRALTDQRTTNGITKAVGYTYNLDGSQASVVYPGGESVAYAPGGAGRALSAVGTSTYVTNVHYAPNGALCNFQTLWGNTFTHNYTYNNRLQPVRMQAFGTGYGATSSPCTASTDTLGSQLNLTYSFVDASGHNNGNVVTITNNADIDRTQSFSYDALNRLSSAWTAGTNQPAFSGDTDYLQECWAEQYSYDPWGNLLAIAPSSSSSYTGCTQESGFNFTGAIGANNRLTAVGYSYDAAGNLISNPGVGTYTYNAENQLTSTAGVTYTYDGDGRRVMKSGGTLYWYGSGSDPLQQTDLTGANVYSHYYFNGQRIARREPSGWVDHYALDHLGNTRWVYGYNGVWDVSDFYPFGGERVISSGAGNQFKFTAKERDSESGLDNFEARYMSSSMGRFMRPDPDESAGFGHTDDPQSWNGYAYVRNNPLNGTDPDGLNYLVCDKDGQNCADFNQKQYDQYLDSIKGTNTTVDSTGLIQVQNANGSFTTIGQATYYDEKNADAAAHIAGGQLLINEFAKQVAINVAAGAVGRVIGLGVDALLAARAARAAEALNAANAGRSTAVELTGHAATRLAQRGITEAVVNEAVETAQATGQVTSKVGQYGTVQNIYKGSNGITVIVETEGRNAGKVITAFRTGSKP